MSASASRRTVAIGIGFTVSGFVCLGLEVLWFRALELVLGVSAPATAAVLAGSMLGMGLGAFGGGALLAWLRSVGTGALALLHLLLAIAAAALLAGDPLLRAPPGSPVVATWLLGMLAVIPAAGLAGATFPAVAPPCPRARTAPPGSPPCTGRTSSAARPARSPWRSSGSRLSGDGGAQPQQPWAGQSGSPFTVEFFRLCRDRLRPGGHLVQWFQTYGATRDEVGIFFASVAEVFPSWSLWSALPGDLILVAPGGGGEEVAGGPEVNAAYLGQMHAVDAPAGPVNTDDRPVLSFRLARRILTSDTPFDARELLPAGR